MASSVPVAPAYFGWQPHWPESQRLAESLRSCRLTLLCGDAGSGKTSLLADGLMPLLQRRAVDTALRAPRGSDSVVKPFPERRSAARARLAEIVVFFEAGASPPLARLHHQIDAALLAADVVPEPGRASLSARVESLSARWGTNFLFVFDRFDELLRTQATAGGQAQIVDELVDLLNRSLPANVLIAMRSDAYALLEPFEARLRGVDLEMMVLPGQQAVAPAPLSAWAEAAPSAAGSSVAAQVRWHEDSQRSVLGDAVVPPAAASSIDRPARRAAEPATAARKRKPSLWRVPLLLAPLVLVGFALPLVWVDEPEPLAVPAAVEATRASTGSPAVLPAEPALELWVDNEAVAPPRLPAELARALAAGTGAGAGLALDVRSGAGGLQALAADGTGVPRLAIVRYDLLQAAASSAAQRPLAIVTPLYTEEIHVVVRADSPLQFIHEIEGQRINVGPVGSARAVTADSVYRRMFGSLPSISADTGLGAADALQQLVAGQTLDVVVLVAPKPAESLAGLRPELRNAVKLLRLAPDHPASRRALQAYLPASVDDIANTSTPTPTPTLAAMAFLVTSGAQDAMSSYTLARFTRSLCDTLPALQRRGDAKWLELRPGLELPTAWPTARAAAAAFSDCARPAAQATAPSQDAPAGISTTVKKGTRP